MPIPSYVDPTRNNLVGPQLVGDGAVILPRSGKFGEGIVAELYGKYGELTQRGLVYAARVGTAAAIPVNSTLTNAPTLWNPSSSGKMVIPLKILLSVGAIGTPILFGATLSTLTGAGDGIATGGVVVTFTNQAPVNMLIGRGSAASTKFAPAVVTFTVNPTAQYDLGLGHFLEGTAASGQLYTLVYDFDSTFILPPGTTASLGATIASSTTFYTTILFAEVPMVAV
jgi:hypothetical protein